jgi:uncharacterized protein (TIGR02996 family)
VARKAKPASPASPDDDHLRALVAQWRAKPAVELAEAIVALGAKLDRARARLPGRDMDVRLARWLALDAETHDDALTGWALDQSYITKLSRYQDPTLQRIAEWPPDPRITDRLCSLLAEDEITSYNSAFPSLIAALAKSRDVRALPVLDAHADPRCAAAAAAIRKALPRGAPKLTAADRARFAGGGGGRRDEAAMLAAVWADPADDAPRLVYADYLQEQGDPRGEFIALQCAARLDAAGKARMRRLKQEHAHKWLGPLAPAILEAQTTEFERGFLAKCTVCAHWSYSPKVDDDPREQLIRTLLEHPAWSTLREIKMAKLGRSKRAPLIAHCKRLGVKVTIR